MIDLTGQRFTRLLALEFAGLSAAQAALWRCRCDCGQTKVVSAANVQSGNTKSCGCLIGGAALGTHNKSRTPAYKSWLNMKARCTNPRRVGWENYGGRGITFCPEWADFKSFYEAMGDRPAGMTLDRIDNDGSYEPGNCRWATRSEQRRNQRNA